MADGKSSFAMKEGLRETDDTFWGWRKSSHAEKPKCLTCF